MKLYNFWDLYQTNTVKGRDIEGRAIDETRLDTLIIAEAGCWVNKVIFSTFVCVQIYL